jgi:chaperonin GroEL (HSP60 family)
LVRRAKLEQIKLLGNFLHIKPIESIDEINNSRIGIAGKISWRKMGKDRYLVVEKNLNPVTEHLDQISQKIKSPIIGTVLIGGSLWYVCQEIQRFFKKILRSAIEFKKFPRFFFGGGNLELSFSTLILKSALEYPPKISYILQKFSNSFLIIPKLLIQSIGMDPIDGFLEYQKKYHSNPKVGIDYHTQSIRSFAENPIFDNYHTKNYLYSFLFEILCQVIRVDKILKKKK